jgi:hypothetical protein
MWKIDKAISIRLKRLKNHIITGNAPMKSAILFLIIITGNRGRSKKKRRQYFFQSLNALNEENFCAIWLKKMMEVMIFSPAQTRLVT